MAIQEVKRCVYSCSPVPLAFEARGSLFLCWLSLFITMQNEALEVA